MLQRNKKTPTFHVHVDFNTNDEENWDAPFWCNAHSLYPNDEETPIYTGADVRKMNFQNARMIMAEFSSVDARKVDFSRAELSGAEFDSADLRAANLREADLCKANLHRADLRGANLSGSDLMMARLTGANLVGANLSGACVDDTDFTGASFDEKTELPFTEEEALQRGMCRATKSDRSSGGIYE